ncbi:MAG: hypothetical protein LBD91_06705 [Prevotellaceae bacterium]|jgi:hypothetical protein|nr:hypothetical protein [Prevotellaceae bacterium]
MECDGHFSFVCAFAADDNLHHADVDVMFIDDGKIFTRFEFFVRFAFCAVVYFGNNSDWFAGENLGFDRFDDGMVVFGEVFFGAVVRVVVVVFDFDVKADDECGDIFDGGYGGDSEESNDLAVPDIDVFSYRTERAVGFLVDSACRWANSCWNAVSAVASLVAHAVSLTSGFLPDYLYRHLRRFYHAFDG